MERSPRAPISVVCPTYNSAAFVERALRSIAAQTVLPCEVVVSDDGSSDETVAVVEHFFSNYPEVAGQIVLNRHRGPGATRNAGIRASSSAWIAFLDSDDEWLPTKIERVVAVVESHHEINFICHNEENIGLDGARTVLNYASFFLPAVSISSQLYRRCLFSTSSVTCTRSLLDSQGMFDESLMSAQDYELWLKLSPALKVFFIEEVLGRYIDRPGNITSGSLERRLRNQLRILLRHRAKVPGAVFARALLAWMYNYGPRRLLSGLVSPKSTC